MGFHFFFPVYPEITPGRIFIKCFLRPQRGRGIDNTSAANSNTANDGDMLSSVRCGFRAVEDDCEAVFIALGDQPTIRSGWITDMIAAYRNFGRGIIVPVHQGKRGHPLLLSRHYREELLHNHDGVGLRGLLAAHADDLLELEFPTPDVLVDLDVPADYQRLTGNSPTTEP